MALLTRLATLPQAAASELFGPDCAIEDDERLGWRRDPPEAYCPRCGASAGLGAVAPRGCGFCTGQTFAWDRITRLAHYAEPMSNWIRNMKFHGQWRSATRFGKLPADALDRPFDHQQVLVCAVPMHWSRRWQRGFDQALFMARALARVRCWPLAPLLKRPRATAPQTSVVPSKRAENIRGAIGIQPVDLNGYEVILVDDVKTTGATLSACSRVLQHAEARTVQVAVAAVADPR